MTYRPWQLETSQEAVFSITNQEILDPQGIAAIQIWNAR